MTMTAKGTVETRKRATVQHQRLEHILVREASEGFSRSAVIGMLCETMGNSCSWKQESSHIKPKADRITM